MKFVHLHTHSHYSLLDGLSKIEQLVKKAKETGMDSLAITDHGNLYGAIEFYQYAQKHDIKPIIGCEMYICENRFDKNPNADNRNYYHLVLLAKNNEGYQNLIKLVTASNLEGFYYKPRIDKNILRQHKEGLIALSGCLGGEVSRAIFADHYEKAKKIAQEYAEIFGPDNYYIEIQQHLNTPDQKIVTPLLVKLAKELNLPLVATQDSHYLNKDDAHAHDVLLAVQTGTAIDDKDRLTMRHDDFSMCSPEEMAVKFAEWPEAIANTQKIADRCQVDLTLGKFIFPNFELEPGKTADQMLNELTLQGAKERGLDQDPQIEDRRQYELEIIKNKNYAPYFLVVADLLRFSHQSGIYTTVRGSAAGSLVAYLSGITSVNPIEFQLPFERFLNPYRPSAPDIDMDYADNRRDEVIEYARRKYGSDHVAQIGTFGTMMARGAVRDVARALGYPYAIGDRLSKLIPMGSQGFPMTIEHALEITPELKEAYQKEPDAKEILDLARRLEGCVRHISVHAAGVVISPTPLSDFTPIQFDPKGGKLISQYDMHAVEDVGLLKFDFLGIRNLAILADAVRLVKKYHDIDINIQNIPRADKKTFAMLAKGETIGLFQLNGTGMTKYLMDLRATSIHDINAMVALYRPGPMESIPEYIKRKRNPRLVQYLDPRMKDILDQSYGVITYQDDVMLISIKLGGYSWLEADKLRKAMGKKIPAEMEAQKEKLLKGFVQNGMTPEKAKELWALIEPFAAYGFNKAHAASYGLVAYQTAYMKANFPSEYMAAILTAESGDVEKVSEIIAECKRMEIPVLPPDVNESMGDFAVIKGASEKDDKIRFGLHSVKNLGNEIADAVINEREENGRYKSYSDFLERVQHKNLNKKSLEALIKCGAMDAFGERGQMIANMEESLAYNKEHRQTNAVQTSLFGLMETASSIPTLRLKDAPPSTQKDKLTWEKELLGLYISGHPLDKHKEKLDKREWNNKRIKEEGKDGAAVTIVGIVEEMRDLLTKKNERMAFMKVADYHDSIEVVVFPRTFEAHKEFLALEKCLAIKGKFSTRNGDASVIADAMKVLD